MIKFTEEQKGILIAAANSLDRAKMVDAFCVEDDFAEISLDDFNVRITSPMADSYQFTLHDGENRLIHSVVTDTVKGQLPVERLVVSLIGTIMLQSFSTGWDGYTIQEN